MDGERQWLTFLGAVLLVAFGSIADGTERVLEIKRLCDGEVIGVQFQKPAGHGDPFVCVLDPEQNNPQTLDFFLSQNNTGIMQHDENALRRIHNDVVFDVRLITRQSQELDLAVYALNLFNGTILFLNETHCGNVTFDSLTPSFQFLLKNDCDCQPNAPVPLITPTPSVSYDNDCVFHNERCRLHKLCDGEITGVQFEYSDENWFCIFDQEADNLGSEKVQHNRRKYLNYENGTHRLNVRMIDNSTWGLDPAFALRLSDQTVLYIVAVPPCTVDNIINEGSQHSPVKFVLAGNGSCNCDSGLRTSSIVTTTAPDSSPTPYTTVSPTTGSVRTSSVVTTNDFSPVPNTTPTTEGPSVTVDTVLSAVGASISTLSALVVLVLLILVLWYIKSINNKITPAQSN